MNTESDNSRYQLRLSDLNDHAYEQLMRNELIDQLSILEEEYRSTAVGTEITIGMGGEETIPDEDKNEFLKLKKLIKAFKHVIAYNSVPGTYEEGNYDL